MTFLKIAVLAVSTVAFAGAASACPFGKAMDDKAAEAPILKPSAGS